MTSLQWSVRIISSHVSHAVALTLTELQYHAITAHCRSSCSINSSRQALYVTSASASSYTMNKYATRTDCVTWPSIMGKETANNRTDAGPGRPPGRPVPTVGRPAGRPPYRTRSSRPEHCAVRCCSSPSPSPGGEITLATCDRWQAATRSRIVTSSSSSGRWFPRRWPMKHLAAD